MAAVSRADFQRMAEAKLQDALLLLQNNRHSNAYYLSGYAIEMALKAAISRQIRDDVLPDRQLMNRVFVHDFNQLLGLAGIRLEFEEARRLDPQLDANWATVSQWKEDSRYDMIDPFAAVAMVHAVGEEPSGVLKWLRNHW